jgi:xanthine/uracil/vitamin C permease (AzgA family)
MAQEPNTAPEETGETKSAASKLFDIRLMIGGLFVVYGVLLTVYGFFTTPAELQKAAGININLWLGLGMLVLGVLFLLWMKVNPLVPPDPSTIDMDRPPAH